jgi:hypothetical protein
MGERWKRFWAYLQSQFSAWFTWGLFSLFSSLGVTGLVWVFTQMAWYLVLVVLVCVSLLIFAGVKGVRMMVREIQGPGILYQMQQAAKVAKKEEGRNKAIRKLFQELVDEGEAGQQWSQQQVDDWMVKIELSMIPLLPQTEINEFLDTVQRQPFLSTDKKRECCLAWLRAVRLKFWVH